MAVSLIVPPNDRRRTPYRRYFSLALDEQNDHIWSTR